MSASALETLYALKMLPGRPEQQIEDVINGNDMDSTMGVSKPVDTVEAADHPVIDDEKSDYSSGERASSHYAEVDTYFYDPNYDDEDFAFEDESPYPEVRSAVANTDDPTMPVSTLRVWAMGLFWAVLLPGLNQFFFFRYPAVEVTGIVAQLVTYPMGRALAAYTPRRKIFGMELNPGPFTIKEHVLVTIMGSVACPSAYASDIIAVQTVFYKQNYNFAYKWFLVMSTQLIGFSMGGIARHILVEPPSMIWPTTLVTCSLFNTLHSEQYPGIGNRGGPNREKFFWLAFFASFVWYFFPGYLLVAQVFGYVNGMVSHSSSLSATISALRSFFNLMDDGFRLGLSLLTFDWAQIAYIGSPLATPWWAQANVIIGFFAFIWILTPILHFSNVWSSQYMPILSHRSYDNMLNDYNVSRVLNNDLTFNLTSYQEYSPIFLSTGFALAYGLSFASITATLSHSILYFRKQILVHARRSISEQPDIHSRLMSKYRQVPEWWYLMVFMVFFTFGVISIEVWPTQMPVWAFVVALGIAFAYVIPVGMIQAITNQQLALNVITELVVGYAVPGRPIAMMLFKTWGYVTMAQALTFSQDMKLGHYMKIPPRAMFFAQVICSIIGGTIQLGVQSWMFSNIRDICHRDQPDFFTCPGTEVFGVASIIWGVIALVFFFIIGAVAPIISWLLDKKYPNTALRYVNPVLFNGTKLLPPATTLNYIPWGIVGFTFQYLIRRRHFSWWTKYNYVLSAALDSGLAVSIIFIYFTLQYPKHGTIGENTIQKWWGNTVWLSGADGRGIPIRQLSPGEKFGPTSW
ncbi:hypothetical protein D9758_012834 [Tetrapyrgos nigripes]|uniref:OPT oligopeptide transporter n=1 Tax=Tetrapyrgos nigripes TaxID=182062 RepID=A0A8H5CAN8_9AGAR|nr:hypothetical protein D9758_012834 [Tetrapyrgos nigripes]